MTPSAVPGSATAPRNTQRSSAHLGATLRSVLVAPTAGFEAARALAGSKRSKGITPAEGYMPYVLTVIGGAALMLLWLKLSAVLGLRDAAPADFRWSFLLIALAIGSILNLAAQFLWGWGAAAVLRAAGRTVETGDLRMAWGAASFPQFLAIVLLLPADVLVVGPEAFTTAQLTDAVSSAWASLSIAVAVATALWSAGLLVKGTGIMAGVRMRSALIAAAGAGVCIVALVIALRSGAIALMGSLS